MSISKTEGKLLVEFLKCHLIGDDSFDSRALIMELAKEYIKNLPDDASRVDFIESIESVFCRDCGSLDLPCYCQRDE